MNSLDVLLQSMPAPARLVLSALETAQRQHSLFPVESSDDTAPFPIVIGLSGGADSMCLVHALWMLAPHWNLALHAAHVDHNLRPESGADAEFACRFAEELGVAFHLHRLDPESLSGDVRGVEAAARAQRYAFLGKVARKVAGDETETQTTLRTSARAVRSVVAVAHHKDDQAETVMMNMVRGSGLRGLSGIPWSRPLDEAAGKTGMRADAVEIRLVRPLLAMRHRQLLDYNRALGLAFRMDETNFDTSYVRNRIRHEVIPQLAELNPQVVDALARTAEVLRAEVERTESLDSAALASIAVDASAPLRYVIDLAPFVCMAQAAQRGAVRTLCERMGLDSRELGFDAVNELLWRIRNSAQASGPHSLAGDLMWTVLSGFDGDRLILSVHRHDALPVRPAFPHLAQMPAYLGLPHRLACPADNAVTRDWTLRCQTIGIDQLPDNWQTNDNPWRAFMDADRVDAPALAAPEDGLRCAPLGLSGRHKTLGDIFTDAKTPTALRTQWPIVLDAHSGAVLWVCGHTIAEDVRITDATRYVLAMEWIANPEACADEAAPIHPVEKPCAPM